MYFLLGTHFLRIETVVSENKIYKQAQNLEISIQ